jgi:hypothetical protein
MISQDLGRVTSQDLGQGLLKTWEKDFSRPGTSDFSRLRSLVLVGMGLVKFRRKKFQFFEKSKNAANLLKYAQNQKFSENSEKIKS